MTVLLPPVATFPVYFLITDSWLQVEEVAISHFVPLVYYDGAFPTSKLAENGHGDFTIKARVHLYAPRATQGTLRISTSFTSASSGSINIPAVRCLSLFQNLIPF